MSHGRTARLAALLLLFSALSTAAAGSGTVWFNTTGYDSWTAPADTTEVTIEAWGANGSSGSVRATPGSFGGHAEATFSLAGGERLNVWVGGAGGLPSGGANGGGAGGNPGTAVGGGGGGMSNVSLNTNQTMDTLVVGAGGGGAGDTDGTTTWDTGAGGAGGANTGVSGGHANTTNSDSGGGAGGNQVAGGSGGASTGTAGNAGGRGFGGAGVASSAGGTEAASGGGGAGWFGGGSGGAHAYNQRGTKEDTAAGGGAGSNFVNTTSSLFLSFSSNESGVSASNGGDGGVMIRYVTNQPPTVQSNVTYNGTGYPVLTEQSVFVRSDTLTLRANVTDPAGPSLDTAQLAIRNTTGHVKLDNATMASISVVDIGEDSGATFEANHSFSPDDALGDWSFDIYANDTNNAWTHSSGSFRVIEKNPPLWRKKVQNASIFTTDSPLNLASQGNDTGNLSHAFLATNETGSWENKTANYSSPAKLYTANTWTWSNFTWMNNSISEETIVGWRVWYNDTFGNYNVTDAEQFCIVSCPGSLFNLSLSGETSGPLDGFNITLFDDAENLLGTEVLGPDNRYFDATANTDKNHSLSMRGPVFGSFFDAEMQELNVTAELDLTTQLVENYTDTVPAGIGNVTSVFAFNDTDVQYGTVNMTFPKLGTTPNAILHCTDWNFTHGNCSQGSWQVNGTSSYDAKENDTHIWFQTSVFDAVGPAEQAHIHVELADPPKPFSAPQNDTFLMNATATCRLADCGWVNGTARYNASGAAPDTQLPELSGKPFHTTRKDSNLTCARFLHQDETCNVTWQVNVTGDLGSVWNVDVNFTTNSSVSWNDTGDAQVKAVSGVIDIVMRWSQTSFGDVVVGNSYPAEGNADDMYNVTVTGESSSADLWIRGTDMKNGSKDTIGVTNISWNATENNDETTETLTETFSPLNRGVGSGTNVTTYYWIDVPFVYAGEYNGTLEVKANATS